jgi:hypothetical protein
VIDALSSRQCILCFSPSVDLEQMLWKRLIFDSGMALSERTIEARDCGPGALDL